MREGSGAWSDSGVTVVLVVYVRIEAFLSLPHPMISHQDT
jgi:hypothetical protein